ncbi:MAG: phage/plasmid primase, P4 family [Oscillospiraceae bacterium]
MTKSKTIVTIAMAEIMKNGFESKSYEAYSEKLRKLNADYTEEDIKFGWDEASKKVRALYESAEKVVPSEFSIDYDKFFSEFDEPVLMDDEESDIIRIADLFAESSKSRIVFSTKENSWFVYQNGVWHSDQKKNFVYRFAADFVNALIRYTQCIEDDDLKDRLLKITNSLESLGGRKSLVGDAQRNAYDGDFDANKNLFNVLNGTFNLETLEFYPHRPEDYLTAIANVYFDPTMRREKFDKFVDDITESDKELAHYLQKVFGYSISSNTELEKMFIFYGPTARNGKGTICGTVQRILGDYSRNADMMTFYKNTVRNSHGTSSDVVRIAKSRMVLGNEIDPDTEFDANFLKTITGGDMITCRPLYHEPIEFFPECKIIVCTNNLPKICDRTIVEEGRRIDVVPFNHHFGEDEVDCSLKKEFFENKELHSGILNWLLEGYLYYKAEGIAPIAAVTEATNELIVRSGGHYHDGAKGLIDQFISEKIVEKEGGEIKQSSLFEAFVKWTRENYNLRARNLTGRTRFLNHIRENGFEFVDKRPKVGGATTKILLDYELVA